MFAADPPTPPKPLPDDIVKAWTDAGAEVGWMQINTLGRLVFVTDKEGKEGDVPAFRFKSWKDGVAAKLPSPDAPFGLDLEGT